MQQGDVKLFQTVDGGNINVESGIVEMSGGLETAAYLALFGGNEDAGLNWWGNIDEGRPERQYISETQTLLQSLPATTGNLQRLEKAIQRDLNFFITEKIANLVESSVTLIAVNKIQITIIIQAVGLESEFQFIENWKSAT